MAELSPSPALTFGVATSERFAFGAITPSPAFGYTIFRASHLLRRWHWTAHGPLGTASGDALSEAVARSRAVRAMERLRG